MALLNNKQVFLSLLKGDSAYQVAVRNGFKGTEEEWLASLRPDAFIVDSTGTATDMAMSQKATTNQLQRLDVDIMRIKGGNNSISTSPIMYCTTLDEALVTVTEDNAGVYGSPEISDDSVCAVYADYGNNNRRYVIILLKDIEVPQAKYTIDEPVEIIFAGKFLTFPNCEDLTKWKFNKPAYLNGTLGGGIHATFGSGESTAYAMLFNNGCIVDGGFYSFNGGEGHEQKASLFPVNEGEAIFKNLTFEMKAACTGEVRGLTSCLADKLVVDNVTISVNGTDGVDTSRLYGLYCNNGSEVCVKNTHITVLAKSRATYVYGMTIFKGTLVELENNTIYVDAANNDVGKPELGGVGYACIIYNNVENAVITGGEYVGVHTGISVRAKLVLINGGKFVSCAHGGFYYSSEHEGAKCYVKNAQIGTCAYSGIFIPSDPENTNPQGDMGNRNPLGSFYVSSSNSEVHVDNCEYLYTDDTQYAGGVLRNDDDGKTSLNMSLYISNVAVPEGHKLRADTGNHVYVGAGTNITKDNMCVIYAKPIDEATLVYTGDNEYTYENAYANKQHHIIVGNVADNSSRITALEHNAGIAHTTVQHEYVSTYEEYSKDEWGWTSTTLPQNVHRYARIAKLFGVYSTYADYTNTYKTAKQNPCKKISLNNGVTIEIPENLLNLTNFGVSEHDYIFFKQGKAHYHQGTKWYTYAEVPDGDDTEGEMIADVYDYGQLFKLRTPIITDISNQWNFDGFIDLEGATNITVETQYTADDIRIIADGANYVFKQAEANVLIQFELI